MIWGQLDSNLVLDTLQLQRKLTKKLPSCPSDRARRLGSFDTPFLIITNDKK